MFHGSMNKDKEVIKKAGYTDDEQGGVSSTLSAPLFQRPTLITDELH